MAGLLNNSLTGFDLSREGKQAAPSPARGRGNQRGSFSVSHRCRKGESDGLCCHSCSPVWGVCVYVCV